ncbi:copper resistance-related lipoprotein [Jeongeupia sp. HS-3]|uniref:hypothetical protein n=1 Tax=Jeongeupia sp. HS-3 TaxID=1009682 RepID=UPI0018A5A0C5|nr:hypothetical protein [Jeongeupia sp. HS-3]BCL74594.1 copper resistance-related lipoprotein [Jeongeupia sp. HS-3]
MSFALPNGPGRVGLIAAFCALSLAHAEVPSLPASYAAKTAATIATALREPLGADLAIRLALLNNPQLLVQYPEWGLYPDGLLAAGVLTQAKLYDGILGPSRPATRPLRQAMLDVVKETRAAWLALALAERQREIADQLAEAASAAALLAAEQQKAGNLSDYQSLPKLQTQLQAERNQADARRAYAQAHGQLARLLGLPAAAALRTSGLPPLPASPPKLDAARLTELAWSRRADAREHVQEAKRVGYSSGRIPTPLALPLFGPDGSLPGRPLDDFPTAWHEAQALRNAIAHDVAASVTATDTAWAHAETLQNRLLPAAKRLSAEALKHYNGMLIGVYELIDAKSAELTVAADTARARHDFWLAWWQLEADTGGAVLQETPQ